MAHRTLLIAAALLAIGDQLAPAASPKLGWAGGDASDHNASNASWYYRWWHTIPVEANGSLAEFIPLIKFPNNIQAKVDLVAALPDVDTLLVLNEPERPDQSDTTVQEALAIWPTVQATLPNHRLVSPGVSDNADGQNWLIDFMNQVDASNANADPNDDLRVDAIAFHWYGASSPTPATAATNFLRRVDWYHDEFGLPVWITEFAMHDWEGDDPTQAMIDANAQFLDIVLPELESRSYVERYSYYNWFDDARVFTDTDKAPTVIGDQYVGTALPGETRDLAGQSVGDDVVYLRGGALTNSGAAIPDAMRALDALGGSSTITGAGDWDLAPRRDGYFRVRDGATVRKQGASDVEVPALATIEGDLMIEAGALRFRDSAFNGSGGRTTVEAGATIGFSFSTSSDAYAIATHEMELAGEVDGPVRFTSGSTVTTIGTAAHFNDNLTLENSVLNVGGDGFTPVAGPPLHVTSGLRLDFDAARDIDGDAVWTEAGGSGDDFTFAAPVSTTPVQSTQLPGVTAAYPIATTGGAIGLNGFFEAGAPFSEGDATFEIVFEVKDTNAGVDQVLLEVGGAGRGVAFVLNDGVLTFNVDGAGSDIFLNEPVAAGWRHAVGVIDLATGGGDTVTLYIDGQQVGSLSGQNVVDWAGGNIAGLGAGSNSVTGVSSGLGSPFHGDIAIARFYGNSAFGTAEVTQNYAAVTTAPPTEAASLQVQGDLGAGAGAELRMDIGDAGASDRLLVDGTIDLSGATLTVTHVGAQALAAGETFDLIDSAASLGEFAGLDLPSLAAGLMWNADRLAAEGLLIVTLAGDFNGDGVVDAADYTVWRDRDQTLADPLVGADATGDGFVDQADFAAWSANFGASIGAASAIPEPTAALAAIAGGVPLLIRRRLDR